MIESLKNIFSIPDLRKRVLYTLGLLGVYRIGGHIATPGVSWQYLEQWFQRTQGGGLLGFVDLFAGGNLRRFTIFALGIMPYVSASIILQLLTVISPTLERLSKEGEVGRRKITQWTRYGTVALSIIQSAAIAAWLQSVRVPMGGVEMGVVAPGLAGLPFVLLTILTLTTGTAFIMWLGEQISDRGIGNGISLIIFAGIIVGLPNAVIKTIEQIVDGTMSPFILIALIVLMAAVVAGIVFVERAQRKIPIQYARRVVGRRIYGGQSTYLPLRVNSGGVIPVIFASSILAIPQTMLNAVSSRTGSPFLQTLSQQLGYSMPYYNLLYFVGIIFFCFFYTSIIFNPVDTADNMKKYGGFIPGIRPGRRTAEYIDRILTRITFGGAIYLGMISILPVFLISGLHLHQVWPTFAGRFFEFLPDIVNVGFGVTFYFGGTSLLIVVGVAMDTVQQIESQLIMRNYDGFLKGTRIRGRRG